MIKFGMVPFSRRLCILLGRIYFRGQGLLISMCLGVPPLSVLSDMLRAEIRWNMKYLQMFAYA